MSRYAIIGTTLFDEYVGVLHLEIQENTQFLVNL